jgi:translation initiation factor 2B subunit (eIF-2B alpha/beta/delta family)
MSVLLQVGEEEKEMSELLAGWGQDVAAAVTKLQAGQQHSEQAQQQPQQQQQQAGVSSNSNGPAAAAAAAHAGADASVLAPGGSIELRNVYFEAVPLSLVSAVITDKGVMDKAQVASLMESRARGYEQAFGLKLPVDLMAA